MSSNVGQNYPYASESEEERAAVVERTLASFDGLRDKMKTEASPLDTLSGDELPEGGRRWFMWVCPRDDYRGRLHVAGYAREQRAVYAVCDTCGTTFLR